MGVGLGERAATGVATRHRRVPPRLLEDSIVEAAMTFPTGTGLGWDGLHPKRVARLSRLAVRWIACVMLEA